MSDYVQFVRVLSIVLSVETAQCHILAMGSPIHSMSHCLFPGKLQTSELHIDGKDGLLPEGLQPVGITFTYGK